MLKNVRGTTERPVCNRVKIGEDACSRHKLLEWTSSDSDKTRRNETCNGSRCSIAAKTIIILSFVFARRRKKSSPLSSRRVIYRGVHSMNRRRIQQQLPGRVPRRFGFLVKSLVIVYRDNGGVFCSSTRRGAEGIIFPDTAGQGHFHIALRYDHCDLYSRQ